MSSAVPTVQDVHTAVQSLLQEHKFAIADVRAKLGTPGLLCLEVPTMDDLSVLSSQVSDWTWSVIPLATLPTLEWMRGRGEEVANDCVRASTSFVVVVVITAHKDAADANAYRVMRCVSTSDVMQKKAAAAQRKQAAAAVSK